MKANLSKTVRFSAIALFSICLCLVSCNLKSDNVDNFEFKRVSVADTFSMEIPTIMKVATNLNDEAALQYSNVFKEIYVVVIKENKEVFINTFIDINEYDTALSPVENYREAQLNILGDGIEMQGLSDPVALKINNLNAQQAKFDGKVEGVKLDIAYSVTFLEGKNDLYMIMAWTLKDRKEKYSKMFDQMAQSFKESKF